jgi:DNA-binding transcriptional MerR regulator
MTISEVAKRAGLRPSAIRYYTNGPGSFRNQPVRVGQRRYDNRVLQQLAIVQFAKNCGFTVREVRAMLGDFDIPAGKPIQNRRRTQTC